MKRLKQILSLLLAVLLLASIVSGCGDPASSSGTASDGNSTSTSADDASKAAPDDASEAQTGEGNFNREGFPIVNEPVELTFQYVKGASMQDLKDNEMFQELEKLTNVKINWIYAGEADWAEQRSLLLASGDLPDVFFGSKCLRDVDLSTNLDYFIPLEDYIDDFCGNLQNAYENDPAMRKMITMPDGHIYTLSRKLPLRPHACDVPFINQSWLDRLNLEMPTTTEEFYTVLKAFKEQDANGNGDPNDEVPLTGSAKDNMWDLIRYVNPWGITDSLQENFLALDQDEDKPIFIPADEGYKDFIAFYHRLYSEGLMDQEFFTQDGSMADAKIRNEDVSLVGAGMAWEVSSMTNPHSEEYTAMLPLAGPNGDRAIRGNDDMIIYGRNEFTITTACEYPEVAMRWADTYASDDFSVQSYWGPYGVVLDKAEDGTITFLDPPEGKSGDVWYWEIGPRDHGPKYVSSEFEAKIQLPEGSGDGAKLEHDALLKEYVPKTFPLVNYTPEQMDEVAMLTTDIYKYVREMTAQWITSGGVEEGWDNYIAQLEQMRLSRLMEIYQEALDTYNAG